MDVVLLAGNATRISVIANARQLNYIHVIGLNMYRSELFASAGLRIL